MATLAVGTPLVAGGAQVRARAVHRAHVVSGVRRRNVAGEGPRGPFFPSWQVKKIPAGTAAARGIRARWLVGTAAMTVGTPAVAAGIHGLSHPRRSSAAKADDRRPSFIREGVTGTTDVWREKARNAREVSPSVRALQLGIGAGTGAAGAQIGHKIIDRVHPHTRFRPAVTALAGIGGGLASLPANRAITRRVTRGQYDVTPTGVRRRKLAPVRPSRHARVVETRAGRDRTPRSRSQIVPTSKAQVAKLKPDAPKRHPGNQTHAEWAARRHELRGRYARASHPRPARFIAPPVTNPTARQIVARHWKWPAGYAGAGAVGIAGLHARHHDTREDIGAAAGAGAGLGAHQGLGYAGTARVNRQHKERKLTNRERKQLRRHRKSYGIPGYKPKPGAITEQKWTGFHRNYPRNLPGARLHRMMGYTHGGWSGTAIGTTAIVGGAAAGARALRHRQGVRKYYGEGMSPREKRARVYAAGAIPGPAGPINAARQAAAMAPPDQRRSAAALQYGGAVGGGWAGGVAGAYGAAHLAGRSDTVRRKSEVYNTKINNFKAAATHRAATKVPGHPGRRLAQRVAERSYASGPGRVARTTAAVASRPGASGAAGRAVLRAGRPLAAAPAAAALGLVGGKVTGGLTGGYLGYGEALHREQKANRELRKALRTESGMSRAEEIRQLKRKRHNAALATTSAGIGAGGTLTYAGSLAIKHPATRLRLERASLGTAIAGGGVGAVSGFRGAAAARRDIHARERALQVRPKEEKSARFAKHDERARVHLSAGHHGRPACGTGPRPASRIVQTSRLPGNVTCNACKRTRAWNEQVGKRLASIRPAVIATRRTRLNVIKPVRRRMTVVKIATTMDPKTAHGYVSRYGTRGPLPKGLDRNEKMRAYEGRYVALGGPKGEKWKRRAEIADKITGGAIITGGGGAAADLASRSKRVQRTLIRHGRNPKRLGEIGTRVGLGAAAVGAGSEYLHRHAQHRQASYSHSPAGVAASALRRMRDYTPD
jgi:hypothetical protein